MSMNKTMTEVRNAIRKAVGARLYSNGDLELRIRQTPKVEFQPKDGMNPVYTSVLVKGFFKGTWSIHWGQYHQDREVEKRPRIAICFRDDCLAPLILGTLQHIDVYLQNNSEYLTKRGFDARAVIMYYKNAGSMHFEYLSTPGHPELLDNVNSSQVTLRFAEGTAEDEANASDIVWEMAAEKERQS